MKTFSEQVSNVDVSYNKPDKLLTKSLPENIANMKAWTYYDNYQNGYYMEERKSIDISSEHLSKMI